MESVLPDSLSFIPLFLLSLSLILTILEFIDEKPKIRLTILTIFVTSAYGLLFKSINIANCFCAIFGFLNLMFLIYKMTKTKTRNKQTNISVIIVLSYITILTGVYLLNKFLPDIKELYLILVILAIVLLGSYIFIKSRRSFSVKKLLLNMNLNANYKEFEAELDKLISKCKINEEISYLNSMKVNYLFLVDINRAIELFKTINKPLSNAYSLQYDLVEIEYYLKNNEQEKALSLINDFDIKYARPEFTHTIKERIRLQNQNETETELDIKYPINTNYKFINLSNASFLMEYYDIRNDLDKAKYYADYIMSTPNDLFELINKAQKLLAKVEEK